MTLEEIRGLATEDLAKASATAREELFKRRYAMQTEAVENTAAIRDLRKRIARIETIRAERTRAAAKQGS